MTTDSGRISSPKYNILYPATAFCLYEIRLPPGCKIKLKFERWAISGNEYLTIKTGSSPSDIAFNVKNLTLTESREYGNKLYLELSCNLVDNSLSWHGFKLFYYDNQGTNITALSTSVNHYLYLLCNN